MVRPGPKHLVVDLQRPSAETRDFTVEVHTPNDAITPEGCKRCPSYQSDAQGRVAHRSSSCALHARLPVQAQARQQKGTPRIKLQSRLEEPNFLLDLPLEEMWNYIKADILQTSEEILGFTTKKNNEWFDEKAEKKSKTYLSKRDQRTKPTSLNHLVHRRKHPHLQLPPAQALRHSR
ncbi:hypothetical protein CHS0354_015704 [Potamilus streckersoni]|uniref:Uncharacterized protein n=1 Tax=Potamilus streckersoni TaxID=2493646 RepID=A0AAE0TJ92_9BIVA|nr:hypothetical protein CHS0354_015704 [Potamilus streckersoni]